VASGRGEPRQSPNTPKISDFLGHPAAGGGLPKNPPTSRLHAGLVNVIYPPYQAAELFGRCKRKVSSTDRCSGAFENNLLDLFLSVLFTRRFA
jgi:hypothetical protein